MSQAIGFLGVGTIAAAMVAGLRRSAPELPIHLSPRSEQASRRIAAQDRHAVRQPSNAAVVEASGLVFLTMRPPQLDEAVRGLPFRSGQVVASCIAGAPLADVTRLVAPATACRVAPLPPIARGEGPILLHAAPAVVVARLQGLGELVSAPDEALFDTYMAASASMSSFFALQAALIDWLQARGAPPEGAAAYVRSLHHALAQTSLQTDLADRSGFVSDHETPGGLNQRVRRSLQEQGWFDAMGEALATLSGLRRADLKAADD